MAGQEEYLHVNKMFLRYLAQYPINPDANVFKKFLFYGWRTICVLCMCFMCFQCTMDIWTRDEYKLIDVSDNILNIGVYIASFIRMTYFYARPNELKEIFATLRRFKKASAESVYKSKLEKWAKITKYVSCVWYFNVMSTLESRVVLSLLFIPKYGRVFPLPTWSKIYSIETPKFQILYFYEALSNSLSGSAFASTDLLFACTSALLVGQLQILGCNIKNMFNVALLKSGVPQDKVEKFSETFNKVKNREITKRYDLKFLDLHPDVQRVMETELFRKELHKSLTNCIEQHRETMDYCRLLEKFFSPLMFPGIFFAMLYLIFEAFCIVVTTDTNQALGDFMYMVTSFLEMFVVTLFGQLVTTEASLKTECEKLNDYIYECPWYLGDKRFKDTYIIFKHILMKPVVLTAGPFIKISLEFFLVIVRTTFSYLAVLRKMVDRK